jgi:hypothetical protein
MKVKGSLFGGLATVSLLSVACGEGFGSAKWGGTVRDSAGIAIVTNPDAALWRADDRPTVEREIDIGTAEGEAAYQFGLIAGVDVGSDGSVYVLDQQSRTVRVFDADGKFQREFGRPGSGPGELGPGVAGLLIGPGDTVFVPDVGQQRINLYTSAGEHAGTVPIPLSEGVSIRWDMTPERLLVQQTRSIGTAPAPGQTSAPKGDLLLVRERDGTVRDTIMNLPVGESFQMQAGAMPRMRLFAPEPIWALTTGGDLLFAVNSGFSIGVYSPDGTPRRIIRRPYQQRPLDESDRQAFLGFIKEAVMAQGAPPQAAQAFLDNVTFADVYPAFAVLMGGPDGSILVQRIQTAADVAASGGEFNAQDIGSSVWDVFDAEGRYLGELRLPDRFTPIRLRDDRLYGIWRDDLDVQHVLRLKLTADWTGP